MRRGSAEGLLEQFPMRNAAGKESRKSPGCGAVCTGVKGMGLGFYCSYCDAALKCGLLREQHMTHVYPVTSNRSLVKS